MTILNLSRREFLQTTGILGGGLLLGWLLWSRRRETETVVTDDRALATARTRIQALEADLADCRAASASAAAPVAAASASEGASASVSGTHTPAL